tara:strand:+ start:2964 stop:3308 length:345 start_codon:yes stop_codon:yes gene_type:complete
MEKLNEDQLTEIVIDFDELRSNQLNEGYYDSFGSAIKLMLNSMFGAGFLGTSVKVRGTPREVQSFQKTFASEARYVKTARDYGLDNPRTYKSKSLLDKAVTGFEKVTGLKWPFR